MGSAVLAYSRRTGLAGSDSDAFVERYHEDLAIADGIGAGGGGDSLDGRLDKIIVDCHLEAHFLEQVHLHDRAAVMLFVALLLAAAQGVGDGHLGHLLVE